MSVVTRSLRSAKKTYHKQNHGQYCTVLSEAPACPFTEAKPYSDVPGPQPLPLFGNTWRMLPIFGQYDISDIGKLTQEFHEKYGRICKFSKLVGRPDLLFVFDADEIEKIYRMEGDTPYRPSVPCLVKYKSVVRKDFFGDLPGVVGV